MYDYITVYSVSQNYSIPRLLNFYWTAENLQAQFYTPIEFETRQRQSWQVVYMTTQWIFLDFLADRTNGRAYATVLRLSSVCRPSVCDVMYCG